MQILYIRFLNNELPFGNQDINFGGPIRFMFGEKENTLHLFNNEEYIPNFFNKKISNISAIVGENGVGKSLLLQTITNVLSGQITEKNKYFIISLITDKSEVETYYFWNRDISLNNQSQSSKLNIAEIKWLNQNYSRIKNGAKVPIHPYIEEIKLIYYKNYIEPSTFLANYNTRISDISTEKDFFDLSYNVRQHLVRVENSKKINEEIRPLTSLVKVEWIRKIVNFIFNKNINLFKNLKQPKSLIIITEKNHKSNLKLELDSHKDSTKLTDNNIEDIINDYGKIINKFDSIITTTTEENIEDYIRQNLMKMTVLNAIRETHNLYSKRGFIIRIGSDEPKSSAARFCEQILNQINEEIINSNFYGKVEKDYLTDIINKYNKFIEYLIKLDIKQIFSTENISEIINGKFEIKLIDNNRVIGDFLNNYSDCFIVQPFLTFDWKPSLSAGENSLLLLLGKLNSIKISEEESIILLLDEGETLLHPQLQKEYISILNYYLSLIFSRKNLGKEPSIQIILTTHSPFLLSDLPLTNIIPLEKDSDKVKVSRPSDHRQTFGANIHTLLADSFFMKEGLIGQFAKDKLNEAIKDLTSGKVIDSDRKLEIYKIIQMTGEPIIRNKLNALFKQKFDFDLDRRVKRLEDKLGIDD